MARRLTPEEIAQKHLRRTEGAIEDMKAGVAAVSVAPGVQAAAKADKMLQRVTEAVTSGKWARRTSSVALEDWKKSMIEKGAGRVSAGLRASLGKTTAFFQEFMPFVEQVQARVNQMQDLTLDDALARMRENAIGLSKFKRSGR